MYKRLMGGGLALVVALGLSGCAGQESGGGESKPAGAAAKDPAAALADGVAKLEGLSFKAVIKMGDDGTVTGSSDPKRKVADYLVEGEEDGEKFSMEWRFVDGATYIKMTADGMAELGYDGKWLKVPTKAAAEQFGAMDAAETAKSLESSSAVKWADDDTVTGLIDLTKAAEHLDVKPADVAKLPTKTVPFEASFDAEGRIAHYVVDMPAVGSDPAMKMDSTYSDFGVPVKVTAPPASEISKK